MDSAKKIYKYIIDNDIIEKDYFLNTINNDSEENKLEHFFHTFINESVLSDSAKINLLKIIKQENKKTVYQYFNLVQTEFNILYYDMKV